LEVLGIGHLASIRSAEGLSVRDALARAHYSDVRPQLSAQAFAELIRQRPRLVQEWDLYSADKRTTGGWYLNLARLEIGQFGRAESVRRFGSAEEAVAEYVLRELDFWSTVGFATL
jgi:hypothetical protein